MGNFIKNKYGIIEEMKSDRKAKETIFAWVLWNKIVDKIQKQKCLLQVYNGYILKTEKTHRGR